jgi:hypothetical protein
LPLLCLWPSRLPRQASFPPRGAGWAFYVCLPRLMPPSQLSDHPISYQTIGQ